MTSKEVILIIRTKLRYERITTEELAFRAGIGRQHLSNFLNGRSDITTQVMFRIIKALNLDLEMKGIDKGMYFERNIIKTIENNDDTRTIVLRSRVKC
jgi:transcriptional regulator with XRE-family HTH domain